MPLDGTELPPIARVLIDTDGFLQRGWCKDAQAMTAAGIATDGRDPAAVRWCLVGGIRAATSDDDLFWAAVRAVGRFVPDGEWGLANFNNSQDTVKPILDIIDRAIVEAVNGR